MSLVLLLEAAQDRDRVLDRRLRDEHRLETPRQRRVLLDVLAILVERGRADAVQLTARQRRLQQVRGVHCAFRLARADQRVHFVDEQDHAALRRDHLVQHSLQPLLELAAIFGPGDQRAHVERQELLVAQRLRHVAVDDAEREPFHDRSLAHARLADQHGIVLRPTGQHLDRAPDLLVAADHGIELAGAGGLGEVAGVFLQRVISVLGARRVRRAAFADVVDRGVQRLRRDAGIRQDLAGFRALLHRQRHEKALDGDKRVARLLRDLFGVVEDARGRRRHVELARPGALHLWQLAEREFDLLQRLSGTAARLVDQAGAKAFLVVEQDFQNVFRRELLVAFAKRQRLRGLNEAARPFGIFLEIHALPLWRRPPTRSDGGRPDIGLAA